MPIIKTLADNHSHRDKGALAKLARDTTEASRQEAARSADVAYIFHVVDILSEEKFLRTKTLLSARSRAVTGIKEGLTEAS
jgi:hypothetical protein